MTMSGRRCGGLSGFKYSGGRSVRDAGLAESWLANVRNGEVFVASYCALSTRKGTGPTFLAIRRSPSGMFAISAYSCRMTAASRRSEKIVTETEVRRPAAAMTIALATPRSRMSVRRKHERHQ